MASGESNSSAGGVEYGELWRACAGPLLHLPRCGERVFYFPQGHLEQVAASSNRRLDETLPFDLPSRILCRVVHIELRASKTDEVYAQIALLPETCKSDVTKPDPEFPDPPKPVVKSFCKVLTATDTSTKLIVKKKNAPDCFPPLDMTLETPSQKLVAKDLHGNSWNFKHVFGGKPKRHLLSTGWKRFVTAKRLVPGDSVIFLRGENGELRVGTRRVFGQRKYAPHCYLASDKSTNSHVEVLATAHHALCNRSLFIVFYRPSPGISPFIVGVNKWFECATNLCSIGMKFSMRFEREDHLLERCTGSIVDAGDFSPFWKDSQWRCLKVKWDESATIVRPERISPWEIDPVDLNEEQGYVQSSKRLGKRHHSSAREKHIGKVAREGHMMDMPICPNEQNLCFQLAVQPSQMAWASFAQSNMSANPAMNPIVLNQQNWTENVGQPNWTSVQTVSQICQHSWVANAAQSSYQHQTHNTSPGEHQTWAQMCSNHLQSNNPMGPLYSNEENWFQLMLGSAKDVGHDEPVELDEFGQMFGSAGNGLITAIHFSQLHGTTPPSRVSGNSEESVQGETSKRKASSVEDADSGNDRQVKCRVEPTQCGAVSNSNETHYSSASEREPLTSRCNQVPTPVESTANVSDPPILYRAMDRIFGFLHQLKNYVAK